MFWFGFSKKIGPKTWLNVSRSGPSITRSLGHGARINYSPKRGWSFRFEVVWEVVVSEWLREDFPAAH